MVTYFLNWKSKYISVGENKNYIVLYQFGYIYLTNQRHITFEISIWISITKLFSFRYEIVSSTVCQTICCCENVNEKAIWQLPIFTLTIDKTKYTKVHAPPVIRCETYYYTIICIPSVLSVWRIYCQSKCHSDTRMEGKVWPNVGFYHIVFQLVFQKFLACKMFNKINWGKYISGLKFKSKYCEQ